MKRHTCKVLAVSSSGGHWIQLRRILPAFENCDVTFVTVLKSYRSEVPGNRFYCVKDATRWNKVAMIRLAVKMAWIVAKEGPDVVVSTGAAPGFFALMFGHMLSAKTIWIDSMANVQQLSMSGERVGRFADLWLTQWPHLSRKGGPHFGGAVL